MDTKQVIVMRKDLNMRKGKMIAQGAHASMAVILQEIYKERNEEKVTVEKTWVNGDPFHHWLSNAFAKICVSVDSLEELLKIKEEADKAGIPNYLITDAGRTEFNGVPTETCMAIGPANVEDINKITGHLKLL